MDEFELEQLQRQPQWKAVLESYHRLQIANREKSSDFDGWIPRIHDVTDVLSSELPGIHGKLIAFGFLKFDLAGRDAGMRYQLTPLAKQGLNSSIDSDDEEQSANSAEVMIVAIPT